MTETDKWTIIVGMFTIGWITSMLWQRWKYFKKTGKHLQDL